MDASVRLALRLIAARNDGREPQFGSIFSSPLSYASVTMPAVSDNWHAPWSKALTYSAFGQSASTWQRLQLVGRGPREVKD